MMNLIKFVATHQSAEQTANKDKRTLRSHSMNAVRNSFFIARPIQMNSINVSHTDKDFEEETDLTLSFMN